VSQVGLHSQAGATVRAVRLANVASLASFNKGADIVAQGEPAEAAFHIVSGVVTTYRPIAEDREHVISFLFPGDVFGLVVENGRYVNSARAVTPVKAYRLPWQALQSDLSKDIHLESQIIVKLLQRLRIAQHHAFLLSRKQALVRLAMFLQAMEQLQAGRGEPTNEIYLPMDRLAIAAYVGLSPAAVSRGFRSLCTQGVIRARDRRHVKITDRDAFNRLIAAPEPDLSC
jgi:CRP-like cAMP-binding protein